MTKTHCFTLRLRAHHTWIATAMLTGLALSFLAAPARAHGGEDHSHDKPAATASIGPRMATHSDVYELVAVPSAREGGSLRVYLHDAATNASISEAAIELTVGNQNVTGRPEKGLFEFQAPWVLEPGHYDLTFSIVAGQASDLLIGRLDIPDAPPAERPHDSIWDHVWPHDYGIGDNPRPVIMVAAGIAALLGLIGLQLETGLRRTLLTLASIIAVSSLAAAAVALSTTVSGPGQAASSSAAVLDTPDVSRRLADGAIFVPKAAQNLLGIATQTAAPAETTQKTVRLIGQIVPDINSSGLVQALLPGRIEAPDTGFPAIGARVRKGDVLGYIVPQVQIVDRSDIRQTQADLDRQIELAEAKLRRIEPLKGSAVPEGQVIDARIDLESLRKRRAAIRPVLGDREALIAPVDGILAQANIVAGQVIEAQTLLFQIVDPANLWVEALAFDPALAASIETSGKPAAAATTDGRKMMLSFSGRGLTLRQQAVPLRFRILPDGTPLNIGEPVTVQAPIDKTISATAVPRASVVRAANGQSIVWAKSDAERFEPRVVQTIPIDAGRIGVTAGLEPGTPIVVRGAELINQVR